MDNVCCCCNSTHSNTEFVSMVHKWREYGGYSKYKYPRYVCSQKCLEKFEKEFRCNCCHMVTYDWIETAEDDNGFTYCNDEYYKTIHDKTCYQHITKK